MNGVTLPPALADRIAGVDRVAESAGVAKIVAGREARRHWRMVKVGNSECELVKLTPWSRTAAMVGAVSGVTVRARRPSGTNRIRLCGGLGAGRGQPAGDQPCRPARAAGFAT